MVNILLALKLRQTYSGLHFPLQIQMSYTNTFDD